MKNLILPLLFLVSIKFGYSQNTSSQIKTAYEKYNLGDYKSAIGLFNEMNSQKDNPYDMFMMGMCYLKIDSMKQAKQEFFYVINYSGKFFGNGKGEAAEELAKLYFGESDYRTSLHYFQLYTDLSIKARMDDVNWLRLHFFNVDSQGRCYKALGKIDSAIIVMTPYMFCSYKALNQFMFTPSDYHISQDSLQHDSVCRFYISLLQKRHTNKNIKSEFKKAEKKFIFLEERHLDKFDYLWESITCSTDIYRIPIIFLKFRIGDKKDLMPKELSKPFYTKAYQQASFHDLPVCQMVRELP